MNTVLLSLSVLFGMLFILQLRKFEFQSLAILFSRIFLGIVFIYSGFVKAVDPLGYTYKIIDYLTAFGMGELSALAFSTAILISAIEFIIGFGFIAGLFLRLSTWLGAMFMLVFTPLTLYLAISNPVTDCGCFGDALVITNWQTFWKNLIIDIPIIILILQRKKVYNFFEGKTAIALSSFAFIGIIYVSVFSYQHLPIMDFRPFKTGNNIAEGMAVPEGEKLDVYMSTFTYKNLETKELVEFDEHDLGEPLSNEEKWVFVDSESVLVEEGYHAPIHDFSIVSSATGDITEQVLNDSNYTLILVSYDLSRSDLEGLVKFEQLSKYFINSSVSTLALTAALEDEISQAQEDLKKALSYDTLTRIRVETSKIYFYEYEGNVLEFTDEDLPEDLDDSYLFIGDEDVELEQEVEADLSFDFYICDPTTLKTIVRANPGLVLLKKGTIINKWHFNDFPTAEELEKELQL